MSSNSRITHSKGPAEDVSLPLPARNRKDVTTVIGEKGNAQGQDQANGRQSQQGTADNPSPFARPGSQAGSSTMPASEAGMPPASTNPFARPDSHAGFTQLKPTSPSSSLSSISGPLFQEDVNTSSRWDLVDPDLDTEVANINSPHQHVTNTRQDCSNSNQRLQSNNQVGLNYQLGTLYNQDFFVADTTGRRLSQIPDKSSYPYLLQDGNAALQLQLPDLLIYLKTDSYLIDVNSGHHYAMYNNCIEKMSVLPKLYSAWPYKQLLQAIHDDAVHFGVNSPEPTTSRAPASHPSTVIGNTSQPSTVIGNSTSVPAQQVQQPPSPCRPTVVRYEPPTFSLEVPAQMLTRAERNQVLQNHVAAAVI